MTRSVNGRSRQGPAPAARSRSCPRRASSRSSPAQAHRGASSSISQARWARLIPVQIRFDKAVRASPGDISGSSRAAVSMSGTDTPQTPATYQKPYRAPGRYGDGDRGSRNPGGQLRSRRHLGGVQAFQARHGILASTAGTRASRAARCRAHHSNANRVADRSRDPGHGGDDHREQPVTGRWRRARVRGYRSVITFAVIRAAASEAR